MSGWQDDPIATPAAPQPAAAPWENDPIAFKAQGPRAADGLADAFVAGWQNSATGLVARSKLPDVVLDPQHATWAQKLVAGGTQLLSDTPEMIAGAVGGGAAGGALGSAVPIIGNVAGAAAGAGAGAFALPTAIREGYIQALSKGQVTSSGDFLDRASIVLKHTGRDALIGALTGGAGRAAEVLAAPALGSRVAAGTLTAGAARTGTEAAKLGAEYSSLVLAPAALEGKMPEPEDFVNTAIMLLGLKGAQMGAARLQEIYARTGKTPMEVAADAKQDPTIIEDLQKPAADVAGEQAKPGEQMEMFDLPRAYEPLARETAARDAVPDPSPEAARAFVDKPFAEIPQLPGEPVLPTHVNYNYLNTPEDVQMALSRLSGLYEQRIVDAKRDTVSWEQTYQEAADLFQQTTGQKAPEAPTQANYRALAADLYAQKQLLVSGAEQLMQLRNDYAAARDAGTATPEMKLQLLAQVERVATAQATTRGAQAEVGRALNVLKSTNRDKAYYDQLNSVIEARFPGTGVGDVNFDKMVDLMGDLGSPREALTFAAKAAKATSWDKVMEAWKAGLVSGPFTQMANIMGNATFMATRPLVDTVASVVSLMRSGPDRVRAVEPLARVIGNIQGIYDGAKAFAAIVRAGLPGDAVEPVMSPKLDQRRQAIQGPVGDIVRLPFTLLSAADAFFRVSNERGEAYALASREAAAEGFNPATREFRDRVLELATNPTQAMADQITAAGQRFTFNTPLGEKGQAIQAVIRKLHLEWAVPFVQTPANVAKEMLRLTPLAPVIGEWREAIAAGGAARDQAIAEMAMGTAVGTAVFSLALAGHVSGQGDPDPKKRAVQMASGWQPYSVKVGDTWYSYQRLQPVGTLMGMSADMAEAWQHLTPEESDKVPKILATAFANAITNQTFLQGVTNIVNAISDPGRFGPRFVQGMAASTVPAVVGQSAQMMDPYAREIDSVKDAVQARLPGVRQDLLPKRDPYGEPIPAKDRLGDITPITTSRESDDKVRKEAARLGVGAAQAPQSIELPAGHDKKLGQVALSPEQQDVFATEGGHLAYRVLDQLVHQPTWDNMPDMAQRNAMQAVFEHARKAGRAAALPPEQLQREVDRISNVLRDRMAQGK